MMDPLQRPYLSYLLRLWQSHGPEGPTWRAALIPAHGGEHQSFASLEQLFAFLIEQVQKQSVERENPPEGALEKYPQE